MSQQIVAAAGSGLPVVVLAGAVSTLDLLWTRSWKVYRPASAAAA